MAKKTSKKQSETVCRSMMEFKQKFLPKSYAEELFRQRSQDPKSLGTGFAQELLDGVRRELHAHTHK